MKMCGRYLFLTDTDCEEIQNIINMVSNKYKPSEIAKGEVFPTNSVPVIYSYKGRNILSSAKWGFPSFKSNGVIINARAETVAEKAMFKGAFTAKRCIVPANGYYEWLAEDRKKTKYLIKVKEKPVFFMAGLYEMFSDKKGNPYAAITIITTQANADVAFIHDRMPVILQDEAINTWLDGNITDVSILQRLLIPYAEGKLYFAAA